MAKRNEDILNDAYYNDIIWKWVNGKTMTESEKKTVAGLFRQYPEQMAEFKREYSSSSGQTRGANGIRTRDGRTLGTRQGLNRNLEQMNRNSSWRSNATTSPGGFQKSGLDYDSQMRASGTLTDQRDGYNTAHIYRNGTARVGNGRVLTQREVSSIIQRGKMGATLAPGDQAIYDRFMVLREAEMKRRAQAESEARMQQMSAQKAQEIADFKAQKGIPEDIQLTQQDYLNLRTGKARWGRSLRDVRDGVTGDDTYRVITRDEDAKERAALRKEERDTEKANLLEGRNRQKDQFSEIEKELKSGRVAYTRKQRDAMEQMQTKIDDIWEQKDLTEDEKQEAVNTLNDRIRRIRMNPHVNFEPEETMDENFNRTTRTDDNGIIWTRTKEGWKVAYDPTKSEGRQSAEEKQSQNDERERRRWVGSNVGKIMEEEGDVESDGNTVGDKKYKDFESALKEANRRYDIMSGKGETKKEPTPEYPTAQGPRSWRDIAKERGLTAPVVNQTPAVEEPQEAVPTEPMAQEEPVATNGICPVCGESLDDNGYCVACGYSSNTKQQI